MTYPDQRALPEPPVRPKKWPWIAGGGVAFVGVLAIIGNAGNNDPAPHPVPTIASVHATPQVTTTLATLAPPTAIPPPTTFVQLPVPVRTTTVPAPPPLPPPPSGAPYYSSCAEARAAGVAPLHRGQPGYRDGLDRDGDGIACDM